MFRPRFVALALAALLLAPAAAFASAAPPALAPAGEAPVLLSPVTADVPQAAIDAHLKGTVAVRVRVTPWGIVDSALVLNGDARLRASALAAARWYVWAPRTTSAWTDVTITIDGSGEVEPLAFDIMGMARDAERAGHMQAALDAWAGVLNRCGTHPTIQNPWAIREHIVQLQRSLPTVPVLRGDSYGYAMAARVEQQRTVARAAHAELVRRFEDAQRDLPWWDEPYQWEAASLLGAGRSQDAIRTLLVFRAASRDTAAIERANRALAGIARGDTVVVGEMLKKEGAQFEAPGEE